MSSLKKLDNKHEFVEVYHVILKSVDAFQILSPNLPKQFLKLVQEIYASFYRSECLIRRASDSYIIEDKIRDLIQAKNEIFDIYTSIEIIVRGKGFSIGAANTIIDIMYDVVEQLNKWINSLNKKQGMSVN